MTANSNDKVGTIRTSLFASRQSLKIFSFKITTNNENLYG